VHGANIASQSSLQYPPAQPKPLSAVMQRPPSHWSFDVQGDPIGESIIPVELELATVVVGSPLVEDDVVPPVPPVPLSPHPVATHKSADALAIAKIVARM